MYGTLGIVYDVTKTNKQITSWTSLFGSEFSGSRSIKDSMRDAYAAACLYNARESLAGLTGAAQKNAVQAVFEDTTANTVNAAKATLLGVKNGSVWDVDNVKFDMAAGKNDAPAVALMWSCDAGYVMNDYEDANGEEKSGNRNLWYVVPDEGGNVYIDAFVISKYAKNVEAANWFLKFLCLKDTAIAISKAMSQATKRNYYAKQGYYDMETYSDMTDYAYGKYGIPAYTIEVYRGGSYNRYGVSSEYDENYDTYDVVDSNLIGGSIEENICSWNNKLPKLKKVDYTHEEAVEMFEAAGIDYTKLISRQKSGAGANETVTKKPWGENEGIRITYNAEQQMCSKAPEGQDEMVTGVMEGILTMINADKLH